MDEKKFMELVERLMEAGFTQEEAIEEARERLNRADGGRVDKPLGPGGKKKKQKKKKKSKK